MATDELTFRISGLPDFWVKASREVITENTTLLDAFNANASGDVVLTGWSPKVFDFMMNLLHLEDDELNGFFSGFWAEVKDIWSIASFHEKYVRQAEIPDDETETREPGQPTIRMRQWFRRWWDENGEGFRGPLAASDLMVLVMPAFYIGDAQTFMAVTYDCFLHTNSEQASSSNARMPEDSDPGGVGVIKTGHPLLGQLAAVRASWIGKIENALYYDEQKDGLPCGDDGKSTQCEDPSWCPFLKSAAYYEALEATGCWPVKEVMKDHSIHEVLTMLANNFEYVNYDNLQHVPDRATARAHMPEGATKDKRCRVCADDAVKAAFDRKVKDLIKTLLDEKKTTITIRRDRQLVKMEVNDSFTGLCLDCLTKTKFGCEDEDYWNHCLRFKYDHGCTVRHRQPTWYFSYLGRPENMKQFEKRKKQECGNR